MKTYKYPFMKMNVPYILIFPAFFLFSSSFASSSLGNSVSYNKKGNSLYMNNKKQPLYFQADSEKIWSATITGDSIHVEFDYLSPGIEQSSCTFKRSEFTELGKVGTKNFNIRRDAGTINFNGLLQQSVGNGYYKFVPNNDYKEIAQKICGHNISKQSLFSFLIFDIKRNYLEMLIKNGVTKLTESQIIQFHSYDIDSEDVSFWKKRGFKSLSAEQLISNKIFKLNSDSDLNSKGTLVSLNSDLSEVFSSYVNDNPGIMSFWKAAGFKNITPQQAVSAKIFHIDSVYVSLVQRLGYSDITFDQLMTVKSMSLENDIVFWKKAGFLNITIYQMVSAKIFQIDGDYINSIQKAGYPDITFDQLMTFKSLGINSDYIEKIRYLHKADSRTVKKDYRLTYEDIIKFKILNRE